MSTTNPDDREDTTMPGTEVRVDSEDVGTLAQMLQLGACYIDDQDEGDDAADITAMTSILTAISGLIPGELQEDEPAEPEDEGDAPQMDMTSLLGRSTPIDRFAEFRRHVKDQVSRVTVPIELRADPESAGDSNKITIRGHASVFDRLSEDLGGFRERIMRGAFRKTLDEGQDVRLLINHEPYPVLARTRSKTLELREDPRGLHVYADVAPTTFAQDLRTSMQRGDIDQMSFGFRVAKGGDSWVEEAGQIIRTVTSFDSLLDVSIVTFPAYPQTDVSARQAVVTPDESGPVEELATPAVESAETGTELGESGSATTGDGPQVRARRSLADRIVQALESGPR